MSTQTIEPTLRLVPYANVDKLPWHELAGAIGVDVKMLYAAGSTVAGLLRLRPGAEEPSHLHLDREHDLWVLAGSVTVGETELIAGSYLHVPCGVRHTLHDGGTGSLLFYVYSRSAG